MRLAAAGVFLAFVAHADIITLKNGRILNGTYVGGTPRQIKVEVGDQIETLDVSEVARIEFSSGSYSSRSDSRSSSSDDRPTLRRSGGSSSAGPISGPISGPVSPPVMIQPDPSDPRTQSGSGGGGGYDSDRPRCGETPDPDRVPLRWPRRRNRMTAAGPPCAARPVPIPTWRPNRPSLLLPLLRQPLNQPLP